MFLLVRALSFAVGLFLLTVGGIYAQSRLAAVWVTSADQSLLLSRVADVAIAPDVGSEALTIELFPAQAFQPITGFGASLTESSAYLLRTIPDSARQSLMERFFHPVTGIGLNVLRQPIGASDFALDHYSYDDMPRGQTDLELQHFSIARDRHYVLPALKEVLNINPEVIIVASPWSAPGWMKTTDSMIGGSLRRDRYAVFAEYLVKFLGAYAAETVPIDFLTVVNEPHYTPVDYPGMYMPAADQATFIREHLGPALRRAGIGTQILAWDHNWHQAQYPIAVMNDPGARPYVAGSAFHCYAGDASMMEEVHAAYPDRAIHVTECSSFGTNADFGRNLLWNARMLVVASLRHWAQSVVTWNLVLDEQGGPRTGGCPNCTGLATIDQRTGTVTFNAEYYALAHASRFIRAGREADWFEPPLV